MNVRGSISGFCLKLGAAMGIGLSCLVTQASLAVPAPPGGGGNPGLPAVQKGCNYKYEGGFKMVCEYSALECPSGGVFFPASDCRAGFTHDAGFPVPAPKGTMTPFNNAGFKLVTESCSEVVGLIVVYKCDCGTLGDWCDLGGCGPSTVQETISPPGNFKMLAECKKNIVAF